MIQLSSKLLAYSCIELKNGYGEHERAHVSMDWYSIHPLSSRDGYIVLLFLHIMRGIMVPSLKSLDSAGSMANTRRNLLDFKIGKRSFVQPLYNIWREWSIQLSC